MTRNPAHEYHEVTVPANAPGGVRDGLSPTCASLAPFLADGWRVNGHRFTGDGRARVELYRAKGGNVATATTPLESLHSVIAPGGMIDLRTPAEKASDLAHAAKLRTQREQDMPPAVWREHYLAGTLGNLPPVSPAAKTAAPPVPADAEGYDAWLLDMGAWIGTLDLEPVRGERLRAATLTLARARRRLHGMMDDRPRWTFLADVADAIPEGLDGLVPDTAARAAWGTLG